MLVVDDVVDKVVGLGHPEDRSPNGDSFGKDDTAEEEAFPLAGALAGRTGSW